MSVFSMLNALMTPGLTDAQNKIYAYIVGRANGSKVCWPSVDDIAADLNMYRRTVMSGTGELAKRGLIRSERRYKDTNNYFVVDVPGLNDRPRYSSDKADPPDFAWNRGDSGESENKAETAVTNFAPQTEGAGAEIAPDCGANDDTLGCKIQQSAVQNSAQESDTKKDTKEDTKEGRGSACARAHDPHAVGSNVFKFETGLTKAGERERIVTAWNAIAAAGDLPVVMKMTKRRERSLDLRIAEIGFDAMCEAVRKVAASSFCHGQNDRGWRADFDFLLQPSKLIATLEGRYDDRAPKARPKPGGVASMRAKYGFRGLQPTIEPEPEGRVAL